MPQALIDATTPRPLSPRCQWFLDLETAWRRVLARFLGLELARPDVMTIVEWTQQATSNHRLARTAALYADRCDRLVDSSGWPCWRVVLSCVASGLHLEALPLGLVCGVVFAPDAQGEMALGRATQFVGAFCQSQTGGGTRRQAVGNPPPSIGERLIDGRAGSSLIAQMPC